MNYLLNFNCFRFEDADIPCQDFPAPFIGDALNLEEGEFYEIEEKTITVNNVYVINENSVAVDVIIDIPEDAEIPDEFDYIVVGVRISVSPDDILPSSSTARVSLTSLNFPEVLIFKSGAEVGNATVEEYLVAPRSLVQSLDLMFEALSLSNDVSKSMSHYVDDIRSCVQACQSYRSFLEPREWKELSDVQQYCVEFEHVLYDNVHNALEELNGTNWIKKIVILLKINARGQTRAYDIIVWLQKLYAKCSTLISKFQDDGLFYIGSDNEFHSFLRENELVCCLFTFLNRGKENIYQAFLTYKEKDAISGAAYAVVNIDALSARAQGGMKFKSDLIRTFVNGEVDCPDLMRKINDTKACIAVGPNERPKFYDQGSKSISKFQDDGLIYIGSDNDFHRFLRVHEIVCCLFTFLNRGNENIYQTFLTYKEKDAVPGAAYAVVNVDALSARARVGMKFKSDVIRTFVNGEVDCPDLMRKINDTKACIAIGPDERPKLPPKKRALVAITCPGHYLLSCPPDRRKWLCQQCQGTLYYGFDDHFHCRCGGASIELFTFQCVCTEHEEPVPLHTRSHQQVNSLTPLKEQYILILGQSGVGKSTWINATTNYMAFRSLKEAEKNLETCEPLVAIPVRFHITDEYMKTREILVGDDGNENLTVGESATQSCKTYSVQFENNIINFIDSPGLGDNRGVEEDRKNVQKVLDYVRHVDLIHGICILLKPNETRISVLFSYCLKEILSNLHQSCSKNLLFCFTNARSTCYKPGETLPILKGLLSQIGINIPLSERIFCLDNEAFRYLCCRATQGIRFSRDEQESFKQSWDRSVKETDRLLQAVSILEPHRTVETLSLNRARRMILSLTRPIADITQNIERNIQAVKNQRALVESSEFTLKDLQKLILVPQFILIAEKLGHPRTVCTADKHTKHHISAASDIGLTEYVKHCHPHCYLKGIPEHHHPNEKLLKCWAMSGENCHQCGCSYKVHMHIHYNQQAKEIMTVDDDVRKQIDAKNSKADKKKILLQRLEAQLEALEDEKDVILKTCVKFAHFLRSNAIAAYNDTFGEYLDSLIEREDMKSDPTNSDIVINNKLKEMKKSYEQETKIFHIASKEKQILITPETVMALEKNLYELPIHGKQLKDIIQIAIAMEDEEARYTIKSVSSQPQKKKPVSLFHTVVEKVKDYFPSTNFYNPVSYKPYHNQARGKRGRGRARGRYNQRQSHY